jgi:hypothetical protein
MDSHLPGGFWRLIPSVRPHRHYPCQSDLTSDLVETSVLLQSKRRCCLCVYLSSDSSQKRGQIAHLDGDPTNNDDDNLAFLCLQHHDEYDSRTSVSKGLTIEEVKRYRQRLYDAQSDPKTLLYPPHALAVVIPEGSPATSNTSK